MANKRRIEKLEQSGNPNFHVVFFDGEKPTQKDYPASAKPNDTVVRIPRSLGL